jgi:hypothetical protein
MRQLDARMDVQRKAMLVEETHAFTEFPAGHFHPGMSIAVMCKGRIVEDLVTEVTTLE